MPPKNQTAGTTSSREVDDAVQAVSEQLAHLQTQLKDLQTLQDTRHDNLQSMMTTILEKFTTLSNPQTSTPSPSTSAQVMAPNNTASNNPTSPHPDGHFPTTGPPITSDVSQIPFPFINHNQPRSIPFIPPNFPDANQFEHHQIPLPHSFYPFP